MARKIYLVSVSGLLVAVCLLAIAGCGSVQMRAAQLVPALSTDSPATALSPGCVALLGTSPNGDALIQSLSLVGTSNGCSHSSAYPATQTKINGNWLSYYDLANQVTSRYRLVERAGECLYLMELQRNYGGSYTSSELLLLETGRLTIPGAVKNSVLTVIHRFDLAKLVDAKNYMNALAIYRICAN